MALSGAFRKLLSSQQPNDQENEVYLQRDRWTVDILRLMTQVSSVTVLTGMIFNLTGLYSFGNTLPIYVTCAFILGGWLLARSGRWKSARYTAPLVCMALGFYGSTAGGTGGLMLFYALAVLLSGMLVGYPARRLTAIICLLGHLSICIFNLKQPLIDIVAPLTVLVFGLTGISLVQKYLEQRFQEVLNEQVRSNQTLNQEIALRQQAVAARMEQEALYRRLADNAFDLVLETDVDGVITYASPSFSSQLGYDPSEIVGYSILNNQFGDAANTVKQALADSLSQRSPAHASVIIANNSGNTVWLDLYSTALFDEAGEHHGYLISSRDITRQVLFEKTLQESEHKYRTIIESLPLGIHTYALNTHDQLIFSGYNAAADAILGIDHSALVGLEIESAFPGLKGSDVPAAYQMVARGGSIWHKDEIFYTDEKISGAFHVTAFQPTVGQMVAIFEDITERIRSAEALRATKEKFAKAFMTSVDSININRMVDGLYMDINPGFTELTGYTPEETLGRTSADINIWANPADRQRLVQALLKDGVVNNMEASFRVKNGSVRTALMSASVIDLDGEKCILSITRDIHERRLAEIQLREAHENLEKAYVATLEGWARALELRERETANHSRRVVDLTLRIASAMGMNTDHLVQVRRGALLHDIGKMGIPDSILLKPGPLTADEWVVMRQHPLHAFRLLSDIPYLRSTIDIPYSHHERWDGTGYPQGLSGKEIPLAARIFAVVDVYDALCSDRPYRPAWEESDVLRYLDEQRGKQFDPDVVTAFMNELRDRTAMP